MHYVLGSGPRAGEHRPAIITRVEEKKPSGKSSVALQVFIDNENDGYAVNTLWRPEVSGDQETKAGNTWHWPELAEPLEEPAPDADPESAPAAPELAADAPQS